MSFQISHRAKRGFTLVEMSIVLVIIGLIIGGILKGQEIIAGARQKAVINQTNAVRAATSTYFDRYRALPGDDPTANAKVDANVRSGDGDGVVGAPLATTTINSALGATAYENYAFFNDLIAAGLLNGGQVTTHTANTLPTLNFGTTALPASPISGAGLTVANGTHNGAGAVSVKTTHWLRLHKGPATPVAAVSPRTLANIDAQIDDGLPHTGGVREATEVGTSNCPSGDSGAAATYLATDNTNCIPIFELTQ